MSDGAEWDKTADGEPILRPVTGYGLASSDVGVAVRIESIGDDGGAQYVLSPAKAVELGEDLARLGRAALARCRM